MTVDELLSVFDDAAKAARTAVEPLTGAARRARTERPGQYALDLVADAAVLPILHEADVAVVSEESGRSGRDDAAITVVLDPVDGSTNCSRNIPYWSISLCAVDADGPLCALVTNQATGVRTTAVRGAGAWRDGEGVTPSAVKQVGDAVVCFSGTPQQRLPWKQFRSLGSAALELCDVASGALDAYLTSWQAPWDYLGGVLACREAGAVVVDAHGGELVVTETDARRQLLAAATPELLDAVRPALPS
ncbi:MAG TPA: inositol monophosphatase family protein [Acidimicrobiia bacterium]|jgi:fructose-1,6-bisphosphatase/inositol monophosphatase family enzyme|nr:inositol monophosphatase family protein [Acidimicrobiia bacterium]